MYQRIKRTLFVFGALAMSTVLSACGRAPAVIDPFGPAAAKINTLSWILIGLGTVIYVGVCAFLLVALFRRRSATHSDSQIDGSRIAEEQGQRTGKRIVIWGGMVMPSIVLLVIAGLTLNTLLALATDPEEELLTIEVIGHQWWWEVNYPEENIVTANEIHIPVGRPVRIMLEAEGVVHSFWVPQLHGKLDMIPGRTNSFTIQADEAGEFRGICAEFCGIQHARMLFLVIAKEPEEFDQWLTEQQQPAAMPESPSAQQGMRFFLETPCAQCHAIAGTTAEGRLGPDLTHFAGRREIGAGTMKNTRENLAAWLLNPQERKSGNLMPATTMTDEELTALLDYLATLQ